MRACPLIFTYSIDRAMPSLAMFSLSGERAEEEQEVQTLLKELFHQCDAGTALEKEEAANILCRLAGNPANKVGVRLGSCCSSS